jgi:hypothetical protein
MLLFLLYMVISIPRLSGKANINCAPKIIFIIGIMELRIAETHRSFRVIEELLGYANQKYSHQSTRSTGGIILPSGRLKTSPMEINLIRILADYPGCPLVFCLRPCEGISYR